MLDLKKIAENLIDTFKQAGEASIKTYDAGLKIEHKEDASPVSNGDLLVNEILCKKIKELTPNLEIISEENYEEGKQYNDKDFWLIDPIDGTKEYIAGKDEYTLNAALILNKKPALGLVGVPKKNRIFYSYGQGNSYLIDNEKLIKLSNQKKTPKGAVLAVTSSPSPKGPILEVLQKHGMTKFQEIRSSYKFCVIATGEFDIYAARERANEWDYAAGHAIAEHAGVLVTTLDEKKFEYGKTGYKNLSLLVKRKIDLND